MKRMCLLVLTVLLTLSSVAICFAGSNSEVEPKSNKHTYKTVTEELSNATVFVTQKSVDENNKNMVIDTLNSIFISKIPGFTIPGFASSSMAYTICTGLYGMNGPFKIQSSGKRVTKYQTYVPTGNTTVMWTKLYYYVDYYTLENGRYVFHHSTTVVHNL